MSHRPLNACRCLLIHQRIALCLLFCQQRSHSQCSSASTVKKGFTLNMQNQIRPVEMFNPAPVCTAMYSTAHTARTLCNPIFTTNPFPPCQAGGLSILPSHIKLPLSPRSQLLSNHRSCALLISISCRFHFPTQRQRENKMRWVRGGTNTLTHRGVSSHSHLQPCCTEQKEYFAHVKPDNVNFN